MTPSGHVRGPAVAEESSESGEDLHVALGTAGRVKILGLLAIEGECTKYRMREFAGLNSRSVRRNLEELERIGWVQEHEGEPLRYGLNLEKREVVYWKEFLDECGYT